MIRAFDVLWYPNMAYMIITLAVFSFGLAGVYLSIRPVEVSSKTWIRKALGGIQSLKSISTDCPPWLVEFSVPYSPSTSDFKRR